MVFRREGTYGLVALVAAIFAFGLLSDPAWAVAELEVTKNDSEDPVVEGEQFTYSITVENTGTDPALTTTLTDNLPDQVGFVSVTTSEGTCTTEPDPGDDEPALVCNFGTLDPNESAIVTIVVEAQEAGLASNTATATAAGAVTDSDTETTRILPDLEIEKLDDPDPGYDGGFAPLHLEDTKPE